MHKLPNLYRNRLGTYYLRIKINGREVKRSLGTKEPALAKKAALAFALAKVGGTIAVVKRAAVGRPPAAPEPPPKHTLRNNTELREDGLGVETLETSTPTPPTMLTIPANFAKFDVVLPNGIKVMGIEDDIEARRAANFLRDVLGTGGVSDPGTLSSALRAHKPPRPR